MNYGEDSGIINSSEADQLAQLESLDGFGAYPGSKGIGSYTTLGAFSIPPILKTPLGMVALGVGAYFLYKKFKRAR